MCLVIYFLWKEKWSSIQRYGKWPGKKRVEKLEMRRHIDECEEFCIIHYNPTESISMEEALNYQVDTITRPVDTSQPLSLATLELPMMDTWMKFP